MPLLVSFMVLPKGLKMHINSEWIKNKSLQNILKVLKKANYNAYLVGGCIRNSILGFPVNDIDISTDAKPEETLNLFNIGSFKATPTGFSHGTVTVISEGIPYQITTMRSDQNTDGRHADVSFCDNITKDAERRDFTVNALYADATGKIIDPLGGLQDFRPLKIKFIGNANHRIQEDYLRILRFFRFHAQFSELVDEFEQNALDAIKNNQNGLKRLSKERVWNEFQKILLSKNPSCVVLEMSKIGILKEVSVDQDTKNIKNLVSIEEKMGIKPEAIRRLVALARNTETTFFNLSRREAKKFSLLKSLLKKNFEPAELVYQFNKEIAQSVLAVHTFNQGLKLKQSDIAKIEKAYLHPCPVSGAHLSKYLSGEEIAIKLKEAQRIWIKSNFKSDTTKILNSIGIKTKPHSL